MNKFNKINVLGYDALAESYDYVYGQTKDQEQFQSLKWLNSNLKNGARILDVGSGTGRVARFLSKKFQVIGIDNSNQMIKISRQTAPKAEFIEMNVKKIKFDEQIKFEAIVSFFTFLHVEKSIFERVLSNTLNYLNKGGYLIISMLEGNYDKDAYLMDKKFHFSAYNEEDLIKIFKKFNLNILKVKKQNFKPKYKNAEIEHQIFIYCQK